MPTPYPMQPPSLAELQYAFAVAIVDGAAPALEPWIAARGIAPAARLRIYRHANLAIHVDALTTTFPAVQRLLGADCFDGLATRHAAYVGSRGGNLQDYGADFADFVAAQPETAAWPWLGEVAHLEWRRREVALAADLAPAGADTLFAAVAAGCGGLRLRPCVRVLASSWAVLDLWRYTQEPARTIDPAAAQSVLLWREDGQVAMRAITRAQDVFVRALSGNATLPVAFAEAQGVVAHVAPEALLQPLLEHALFAAGPALPARSHFTHGESPA